MRKVIAEPWDEPTTAEMLRALIERVELDSENTADIAWSTLSNALWEVRKEIAAVLETDRDNWDADVAVLSRALRAHLESRNG